MPARRPIALTLLFALALTLSVPPQAVRAWTLWYVDDDGVNFAGCGTSSDPCRTIQYTLDNRALANDTLTVASGTYSPLGNGEVFPISISKSIMIHGASAATTIIDAANSAVDVISVSGSSGLYIDHFTIRGGDRGIELNGPYPGVITGGIEDNTITGNAVGIYSYSTQVTVRRNDISGNTHYGIQSLHSPHASVERNVLGWNGSGGTDAAIYNDHSDQAVINNVIGWNNGSGIYNSWSDPTITNNTIALNLGGSGITNFTSSPVVANNIVSGNGVYGLFADGSSVPVNTYNDVWGNGYGVFGDYYGTIGGTGSISADPRFVGLFDAHLQCSSPAINSGSNAAPSVPSVDYDGNPRPVGGTVDMGAYEWQSLLRCPGYLPIVLR